MVYRLRYTYIHVQANETHAHTGKCKEIVTDSCDNFFFLSDDDKEEPFLISPIHSFHQREARTKGGTVMNGRERGIDKGGRKEGWVSRWMGGIDKGGRKGGCMGGRDRQGRKERRVGGRDRQGRKER